MLSCVPYIKFGISFFSWWHMNNTLWQNIKHRGGRVLIFILSGSKRPKLSKWKTTTNFIFLPAFYSPFFIPQYPQIKSQVQNRDFFKPWSRVGKKNIPQERIYTWWGRVVVAGTTVQPVYPIGIVPVVSLVHPVVGVWKSSYDCCWSPDLQPCHHWLSSNQTLRSFLIEKATKLGNQSKVELPPAPTPQQDGTFLNLGLFGNGQTPPKINLGLFEME